MTASSCICCQVSNLVLVFTKASNSSGAISSISPSFIIFAALKNSSSVEKFVYFLINAFGNKIEKFSLLSTVFEGTTFILWAKSDNCFLKS